MRKANFLKILKSFENETKCISETTLGPGDTVI